MSEANLGRTPCHKTNYKRTKQNRKEPSTYEAEAEKVGNSFINYYLLTIYQIRSQPRQHETLSQKQNKPHKMKHKSTTKSGGEGISTFL